MTMYSDSLSVARSPLGNIGFETTGAYTSYDYMMPSSYGACGVGAGMYGMPYSMSMNGSLFNMYNPSYWNMLQQDIESSRLKHADFMHTGVLNNEVSAQRSTDSALIQKMLTNGDVQQGVQNLYDKVREGDQDGICREFDKLKNYIYNTYRTEFQARGTKINPEVSARQCIEALYSSIVSAQVGQTCDLRSDIERYGDGAVKNGFMQGFRRGHHKRFVDETLNHCFDMQIDQKASKDVRQSIGNGVGRTASVLEKGVLGAAGGVAATGIALGVGKAISFGTLPFLKCMSKAWKPMMWLGAVAGMAGDIWWQYQKA